MYSKGQGLGLGFGIRRRCVLQYLLVCTVLLQNEAVDGETGQRLVNSSTCHPGGPSSNGVESSAAAADTPGSGERPLSDGGGELSSSSPLHHQFPSPSSSAAVRDDVELLRTQLRNERRRVRHLEELLQHRFSDNGNIREVSLTVVSGRYTTHCPRTQSEARVVSLCLSVP